MICQNYMSQGNQKYLTFLNVTVASDLLFNLITALHLISTLPNEQLETKNPNHVKCRFYNL